MFCVKCGAENPDAGSFCFVCGSPLFKSPSAAMPAPPPREPTTPTAVSTGWTSASVNDISTAISPSYAYAPVSAIVAEKTSVKCPKCGLTNPGTAQGCNCAYDFVTKTIKEAHPKGQVDSSLRGVGGWLLLFCIITTIVAPLFITLEAAVKGITPLVLVSVGVCALSAYAGIGLWRVAPNALGWLKAYFVVRLCLGALGLLGAILEGSDPPRAAGGMFWVIVWWLYFNRSARVRLTYGRNL